MSLEDLEDESYPEFRDSRPSYRKLNVMSEGEKRFRRQIKDRAVVVKTRNQANGESTSDYSDNVMYSLNKDKRWEKTSCDFLRKEEGAAVVERKIGSKVHKTMPLATKRTPAVVHHWTCQADKANSTEKYNCVLAVSDDVVALIEVPTAVVLFAAPTKRTSCYCTRVYGYKHRRNGEYVFYIDGSQVIARYEVVDVKEKLEEMRNTVNRCWKVATRNGMELSDWSKPVVDDLIESGNWVALNAVRKMGEMTPASQKLQKIYAKNHIAMINDVLGIRKNLKNERLEVPRSYWDAEQGVVSLQAVDENGDLTSRTAHGRGVKISGLVRRNKEEAEAEVPDVLYNIIRPELHRPLAKKTFRREKPQLKREKKNSNMTDDLDDY